MFDVDGVLVDSLERHLQYCREKSREYGLGLEIPDAATLKGRVVREGLAVSPMERFFQAVGFPDDLAERANGDYRREFMSKHRPPPFEGVDRMLASLAEKGLHLGLVTSNTLANVRPSLAGAMRHFDPRCLFARDDSSSPEKPEALARALLILGIAPASLIYVGDQLPDFRAATEAGVGFLGVTYGWGIDRTNAAFPAVDSVPEIASSILAAPAAGAAGRVTPGSFAS